MIFRDSLGYAHTIAEPLLKAFCPAPAEPPPGEFRRLVDEIVEMRDRRRRMTAKVKNTPVNTRHPQAEREAERIARADHLPSVRQRPGRPGAKTSTAPKPLAKSFDALARELGAMLKADAVQREAREAAHARSLFADLSAAARAGRLDAISGAKVDALAHRHARELGMETTGVRR